MFTRRSDRCSLFLVLALLTLSGSALASLSGALDSTYAITTDSPYWTEQASITADGKDAAEGRLTGVDDRSPWMETTVAGPTTLYFSYRVMDLNSRYRLVTNLPLEVYIDGEKSEFHVANPKAPYDTGWLEGFVRIRSGISKVKWQLRYERAIGLRAYVDQVWSRHDKRPRLKSLTAQSIPVHSEYVLPIVVVSGSQSTLTAIGLPPGLSIDPSVPAIVGKPTEPGMFEATLTAANASGEHSMRVDFDIRPEVTPLADGLDAPALTFFQPENSTAWDGVLGLSHDGIDTARATLTTASSPAVLSTRIMGPGNFRFWCRNDARGGTNLQFTSHGPGNVFIVHFQSSEQAWTKHDIEFPAGPHLLEWRATGSGGGFYPSVNVYLDSVEFTQTSVAPQSTLAAWNAAWNVRRIVAASDLDGDGMNLLMEYATGGSPHERNPELAPTTAIVDGHLTMKFFRSSSPLDLRYFVEGNPGLRSSKWSTSWIEILESEDTHILARCILSTAEAPDFHMRVRVVRVP